MGYFVAYRHTGADPERLALLLPAVRDSLKKKGVTSYCTYFDETQFQSKSFAPRQIMDHAFKTIVKQGQLFVILDSDEKSEGLLMEVGNCLAKGLKIIVAKRDTIKSTYLPGMSDYSFEYHDIGDLKRHILEMEEI